MPVRFGSGLSTASDPGVAALEAATAALTGLEGAVCDLCVVFASGELLDDPTVLLDGIGAVLAPSQLIGCGAAGVLGGGREIEEGTGVSVWAASLGGGTATTFHAVVESGEEAVLSGVPELEGAAGVLLLVDPYTFPADAVLHALAPQMPGVPLLGGLASARCADGSGALFRDGEVLAAGAVGVRLHGVDLLPCVSQGAAPLGPELTITASEGNVILELAGTPALTKLQEVADGLEPEEQLVLERSGGLMLGVVVDPNKPDYVQGDFLVRPLMGGDPRTGAVAVGAVVRPGQVVRMHARDAGSAGRDLRDALALRTQALGTPAGALVFACTGRGTSLFGERDQDARAVADALEGGPSAGFFAAGEIGPVGMETFLHTFTATIALFGHD